jgi:cardiolipin synthase (CMP-forming)
VGLPNVITIFRALLVPFVFWMLMVGHTQAALVLFIFAGISDALDGFLAKRYNWQSELGAHLDPLADKLLLVSVFVALGTLRELPFWLVVAVVSRDILIVLGVLVSAMLNNPMRMRPLVVSKANTVAQITLAAVVLADIAFSLGLESLRLWLVWITGVLTLASLFAYVRAWFSHMSTQGSVNRAS